MKPGETFRARDLLYAILLASANDASVAAAEHLTRSEPAFADRMNQYARENHAPNTRFANASGLPASGHYSTARDLAALARAALQNPVFAAVVRTRSYTLLRSSGRPSTPLVNENTLLGTVLGMDGVKAGWTREAGACFVGSATRNGRRIITVVLNSPDWQRETTTLLEYGFGSLKARAGKDGKHKASAQSDNVTGNAGKTGNVDAMPHAPMGTATGTNSIPGVSTLPNVPSAASANSALPGKAGHNRQPHTYIPTPPSSAPRSNPNLQSGGHIPDGLPSAQETPSAPSAPFSNSPLSNHFLSGEPENERHGSQGAQNGDNRSSFTSFLFCVSCRCASPPAISVLNRIRRTGSNAAARPEREIYYA